MNIKSSIRKCINSFGFDVSRLKQGPNKIRTTVAESYALIRELGFYPETVLDIGVASGTPELYKAFNNSYFLLIEPLENFESDLTNILKEYRGSFVLAAAGPNSGKATFNVHQNYLDGSSLYKEAMGSEADGHEVTVPVVKIDDVIRDKQLHGPYLIKVDVQGAELDALEGAQIALMETEVVVLEVSLFEFMKGAPQLFEVVSYMNKRGFVAYDIIPGWNRPLDNALGQIDIVFVKDRGMFRRDHSFSTVDQVKALFWKGD